MELLWYILIGFCLFLFSGFVLGYILIRILNGKPIIGKSSTYNFSKLTKRPTVVINHNTSLLNGDYMITQKTLKDVTNEIQALNGKDFNLILNTPGGDMFSSLLLSKALKSYPGKIHSYIPSYAMSGGTILALSTDFIHMNEYSCLGPVDPQIGSNSAYASSRAWQELMKVKGGKASDTAFLISRTAKQVEKSIKDHISSLINDSNKKKSAFVKYITNGDVEHSKPIDRETLKNFGLDIYTISGEEQKLLVEMIQ